ncbi:MAG: glycoside hydrolase family 9 protein [Ignavibacteriales bacterium]|nr:glycoside hydrolase family 9 protein [Ignavibacteriales bacterium]
MKTKFVILLLIAMSLSLPAKNVLLNQVGYLPKTAKYLFVTNSADSFYIHDSQSKQILYSGALSLWALNDESTGLTIYKGDFSSFKQTGKYFITTDQNDSSSSFSISDTVFNDAYHKSLKGFYYQRCGAILAGANAGLYYHTSCHTTDGVYHTSTGQSGYRNTSGGWHDAGDYGKYVVNAGVSVGTLLMAYEYFPDRFNQDDLNIPESKNNIPDILDESRYELNWLLKMQNADGGVFAKLTKKNFEGFIMPNYDSGTRYVYEVASTATADFAAMLARAYRIYKNFDPAFSDQCLTAAVNAWAFLEAHSSIVPSGGFRNPSDTFTGEYGDGNDKDERLWAAAELFVSTGEEKYHSYFKTHYAESGLFTSSMSWANLRPMAHLTYLFGSNPTIDKGIQNSLLQALKNYCNELVTRKNSNGLHVVLNSNEYNWGCNSDVLNKAILLIAGYTLTKTESYFETALDQLNYIYGSNAIDISFVTGTGTRFPMNPHHRPSASDGIKNPVPGLLAGGPNSGLQDDILKAYFTSSTPPALCYIDNQGSYASNEICINWNAPLVFVSGYFNGESEQTGLGKLEEFIPSEIRLEQNYPNPFNGSTVIRFYLPAEEKIMINIFDSLGNIIRSQNLGYGKKGENFYLWDANDSNGKSISTGVYFYQINSSSNSITKKLIVLK